MTKRKPSWFDAGWRAAALLCGLLIVPALPAVAAGKSHHAGSPAVHQSKARQAHHATAARRTGKRPARSAPATETVGPADIIDSEITGLRGSASYYSGKFQGRRTSTGERFDARQFTAASNHFPLGSKVAVWRLDNGRCAIVKINDRMRAGKSRRVIDLSRSAAEYFDMIRAGVIMVRVAPARGQGGCRASFAGTPAEDEGDSQ